MAMWCIIVIVEAHLVLAVRVVNGRLLESHQVPLGVGFAGIHHSQIVGGLAQVLALGAAVSG